MISTHFRVAHLPTEMELERLDLYARQASDFIERCRREEELRQRAEEREALLDSLPAFIWFGGLAIPKTTLFVEIAPPAI